MIDVLPRVLAALFASVLPAAYLRHLVATATIAGPAPVPRDVAIFLAAAATAGLAALLFVTPSTPAWIVLGAPLWWSLLAAAIVSDWYHHLLPRAASYILCLAAYLPYTSLHGAFDPADSLLGGFLGFLLLELVDRVYAARRGRLALGGGDSRYAAAIGFAIGGKFPGLPAVILIACALTYVVALFNRDETAFGSQNRPAAPFGIGLGCGAIVVAAVCSSYS